jgi:hypothetical protein
VPPRARRGERRGPAAATAGDEFANDGRTALYVMNADSAATTVTVACVTNCSYGFDHDTVVRSHFKRLLWNEIVEESRKETTVFKTDEEIIAELNSSVFTEKYPQFVPMPKNTEALYEEQLKKMMAGIPLHEKGCDCYNCCQP